MYRVVFDLSCLYWLWFDLYCKIKGEIRRYTALSNSVKLPCNTPYFSVSGLVRKWESKSFWIYSNTEYYMVVLWC